MTRLEQECEQWDGEEEGTALQEKGADTRKGKGVMEKDGFIEEEEEVLPK